jgi:hypothetical protein
LLAILKEPPPSFPFGPQGLKKEGGVWKELQLPSFQTGFGGGLLKGMYY